MNLDPSKFGLPTDIELIYVSPEDVSNYPGSSVGVNAVHRIGSRVRYELLYPMLKSDISFDETGTPTVELTEYLQEIETPVVEDPAITISVEQTEVPSETEETQKDVVEEEQAPVVEEKVVEPIVVEKSKKSSKK